MLRYRSILIVTGVVVSVLAMPAGPAGAAVTCDNTFHIVATPTFKGHSTYFEGVAAISATDAWAVGYDSSSTTFGPLAEHWDGTSWTKSTLAIPSNSVGSEILWSVSAVTTSN